jgi:GNAT superfamily N-acetyltransferase
MLDQNVIKDFVLKLRNVMYVGVIQKIKMTYRVDEPDDPEPYIYLDYIVIRRKFRNLGIGSKIMKEIVRFAQKHNVQVVLYAANCYGSDLKGLYRFYRRNGFILIKNNRDGKFVYFPEKVHKICNISKEYSYK